jgi:predicted acyl esterase
LIGPWAHTFPEEGSPGPAIGFLQESLRWWDYWLKGINTGIMDEPMLRGWLQESQPPRTTYTERPGRWVAEPGWPPPGLKPKTYFLNAGPAGSSLDGILADTAGPTTSLAFQGPQTAGIDTGSCVPTVYPAIIRPTAAQDGKSLVFTSAPLRRGGHPRLYR